MLWTAHPWMSVVTSLPSVQGCFQKASKHPVLQITRAPRAHLAETISNLIPKTWPSISQPILFLAALKEKSQKQPVLTSALVSYPWAVYSFGHRSFLIGDDKGAVLEV